MFETVQYRFIVNKYFVLLVHGILNQDWLSSNQRKCKKYYNHNIAGKININTYQ